MPISTPSNYSAWLESLKTQIRTARVKASLAVNRELVLLYWRLGAAHTNFVNTLPAPQSDLARDLIKDPYVFDFLGLLEPTNERQIEKALINNLKDFLIELGVAKNTPLWNMPYKA